MQYILLLTLLITSSAFSFELDNTLKLAEQGDLDAQCEIGLRFAKGVAERENKVEAVK